MRSVNNSFKGLDNWIWINDDFCKYSDVKMPLLTHGLNYGGFIFEGIRVYNSSPFLLQEHIERLINSAKLTCLKIDSNAEKLTKIALEIIDRNNLRDAYLRPMVFRGGEHIELSPQGGEVITAFVSWEWPSVFDRETTLNGLSMKLTGVQRVGKNSIPPQAKVAGAYVPAVIARQQALDSGFQDALLLDDEGYLADATAANVFLVSEGKIVTPICDKFLSGITRKVVREIASQSGIVVEERKVRVEELFKAEEVFLSGTAYEIQRVRSIDGHEFTGGKLASLVRESYLARVGAS